MISEDLKILVGEACPQTTTSWRASCAYILHAYILQQTFVTRLEKIQGSIYCPLLWRHIQFRIISNNHIPYIIHKPPFLRKNGNLCTLTK